MEDFFLRAILAGVGVSVAAGPIGCFIVWRRMAYFGAALAHSALLGVALGFLLGIHLTVGILVLCVCMAVMLTALEHYQRRLSTDTLLGVLAHATLAAGLMVIAFMDTLRVDLMGYLFGDVLAVTVQDLYAIYAMAAITLATCVFLWRQLLSLTVNAELAAVDGVPVARVRLVFVLLVAGVIAVGMKIVGMLMIISLVIIPAAAARRFCATPEQMAVTAALIGALSAVLGLLTSLRWDVPSGPTIVLVASAIFLVSISWPGRRQG